MHASPIAIGPINLSNFEVPGSVQFGGDYKLAVHRLATGKRVIERLGPSEGEIKFSGIFTGSDADQRYRRLNNIRMSGEMVWLSWQAFRYKVIIKSLTAEYNNNWWIKYSISCVVADGSSAKPQGSPSTVSLVTSDLQNAITALQDSPISVESLQAGLSLPNALVPSSSDNFVALSASRSSLSAVKALIQDSSADLAKRPTLGLTPNLSANSFLASVSLAGTLAQAVAGSSYLSRIANSLGNLES